MKTIVSLSAILSLVLILIVPGSVSAAPNQQGQINALENEVRQLQAQLQQAQVQLQQAFAQLQQSQAQTQQLQNQLQQSQSQQQQLQTQLQQSQTNAQAGGQANNPAQSASVETMLVTPPIPTTPAAEIENALSAVPANMLPKPGDSAAARGEKMARIKSFLTSKFVDHNVRITRKLETVGISLTNKDHLYVEVGPVKSDDVTWQLHGFYLPLSLTKTFKAIDTGAMVQIDAQVVRCDVQDISGPGATHPVLELTLQIKVADAHLPL